MKQSPRDPARTGGQLLAAALLELRVDPEAASPRATLSAIRAAALVAGKRDS